jgi:hypothetical protein
MVGFEARLEIKHDEIFENDQAVHDVIQSAVLQEKC